MEAVKHRGMRALSLINPWCGLVAAGLKLIENRPRPMIKREDFGKPFALHASGTHDQDVYGRISQIAPELFDGMDDVDSAVNVYHSEFRLSRIHSAVVAVATVERAVLLNAWNNVVDLHDGTAVDLGDQRRWFFGPVGYVLRDPAPAPAGAVSR